MTDKPTPTPTSLASAYLSGAFAILLGTVALYLSVQLLRSIAGVLIGAGIVVLVLLLMLAVRRARRRSREW